jgi:hypothetical protein
MSDRAAYAQMGIAAASNLNLGALSAPSALFYVSLKDNAASLIPAKPQELGNAACIVAIGLDRHGRYGSLTVTRNPS